MTLGLWRLGYRQLTAFDFARELLDQAISLAAEREAGAITFLHDDATAPKRVQAPAGGFAGALFMFNGLMQIPGRENRRSALRSLHRLCRPGAPLLFTTHDRDSSPIEGDVALDGDRIAQVGGNIKVDFRLWDVVVGQQLTGFSYTSQPNNWRRLAHIIADAIYKRVTGEEGYFDTRVAFVSETGPLNNRVKRIAIMDQDGANVRYLTRGDDLVVTPRFSPSTQEITYMSYGQREPRVVLLNIETGQREIVGNFAGMSFAPRFSPDGQRVIMSLQQNSNSNLFVMDLRSKQTSRLTETPAIDTAPSYSPDGARICFESDRGGTQQIYIMSASGGPAQRISFGEGRYSTPVWSPRGDYIAFTKQGSGTFAIGIMKPDGSGERILTEGYHNEGPTFAPNGRVLMFFREAGGAAGPSLYTVDINGRNEQKVLTPGFASDPAWSPLLT